jgi:thymidylate synthase
MDKNLKTQHERLEYIISTATALFDLTNAHLISDSRKRNIIIAKHSVIYVAETKIRIARAVIAKRLNMSVCTVGYAIRQIEDRMPFDKDTRETINKLISELDMTKADKYFKDNIRDILANGCIDENPRPKYKDGTPAHSHFITQVCEKYDISKGEFPLTTLKHTAIKTAINEILWIYQKQSNLLEDAKEMGITWWADWNIGDGSIGARYGYTVAKYKLIDSLINELKTNPYSRRMIMNLYQYSDLEETQGLHPCAYETLWSVRKVHGMPTVDLTLIQRSSDYLVAGHINKIQYVALQMMIASSLGYNVGTFCHVVQNLHIYDRHIQTAKEIVNDVGSDVQPMIILKSQKPFYEYTIDDFSIKTEKYHHYKFEVAI